MAESPELQRFVGGQAWELRGDTLLIGEISSLKIEPANGRRVVVRLRRAVVRTGGGQWFQSGRRQVSFALTGAMFDSDGCLVRWGDSEMEQVSLLPPGTPNSRGQLHLPWNGANK